MRRLSFILFLAILLAGATVNAQKDPVPGDPEYDICVQDDQNSYYLLFNSKSGNYVFERCSDGVEIQGTGVVTVKDCEVILEHNGFNRYVAAVADRCDQRGKCFVRVFKGMKTIPYIPPMFEALSDSNMLDDTRDCSGK